MYSLAQEEVSKPDISHRESGLWFTHRLPAVGVALLIAVFFVGVSTIIGLHTQNSDAIQTAMQAILCPLLFLSSAFMPLESLPRWVQLFALINPITDGIDAARAIMLQG
jgi:ABC-2 type transport system permease protein